MSQTDAVAAYVREHVRINPPEDRVRLFPLTAGLFEKAFLLLPDDTLDLFLSGSRSLTVDIAPDPGLPLGMKTRTAGPCSDRQYTIVVYHEHLGLPEDLFLGSFLRELGHVVAQLPPENEWPATRGDRARFKERAENKADAMVWRWGLKHLSMRHLFGTYPTHRAELIVEAIENLLAEEQGTA
jgi:hypothetical protein